MRARPDALNDGFETMHGFSFGEDEDDLGCEYYSEDEGDAGGKARAGSAEIAPALVEEGDIETVPMAEPGASGAKATAVLLRVPSIFPKTVTYPAALIFHYLPPLFPKTVTYPAALIFHYLPSLFVTTVT